VAHNQHTFFSWLTGFYWLTGLSLLLLSTGTPLSAQTLTDGTWRVGTARDAPTLTMRGTLLTGFSGCQNYSGEMTGEVGRGRVRLAPLLANCTASGRHAEEAFLGKLLQTRSFAVKDNRLEARNPSGQLQFSATRTEGGSAANGRGRPSDGVWQASGFPNARLTLLGSNYSLRGQCNSSSGTMILGPIVRGKGSFTMLNQASTSLFCADQSGEQADRELLEKLAAASAYQMRRGELVLLNRANQTVLLLTYM
jgi:heat shock protein HslJ